MPIHIPSMLQPLVAQGMARPEVPPVSFSGTDFHVTAFIPPASAADRSDEPVSFRRLGEITTLTMSSHRGLYPVRALGEHWVRDFTPGTRSIAGTLVFSVLEKDVFADIYQRDRREGRSPLPIFIDQLPPFTIGVHGITEYGHEATMFLWGVKLSNWGMGVSVEDMYTETTYNYQAKWVTPFLPGNFRQNLRQLERSVLSNPEKKASDLFRPKEKARS